ncbi:class B sortase [Anaerotruncus rubiinfantis]|uniref:class B sortase n=1 Tax=Anaerotruncus rubiinfantis TaxID=1720200 RepID=UPI0034A1A0C4
MTAIPRRLLAAAFGVLLLIECAGCKKEQGEILPPEGEYTSGGGYQPKVPDVSAQLEAAIAKNSDVVGWLQLPNTAINEAVVQTTDNEYYLRRDVEKKYAYEGCYYLDYESLLFDDGADLAQNSIIYGHNLGDPMGVKDNPDGVKFAQLLKLDDIEIAKKTPYIYFTTPAETHIFEIFAVVYCESETTPVPYHYAEYSDEQFDALIADMKARSQYTYDVDVAPEDRIITLSTCSYKYGTYSQNPDQRYIVLGRLVKPGESYHETANLTANASPKAPQF